MHSFRWHARSAIDVCPCVYPSQCWQWCERTGRPAHVQQSGCGQQEARREAGAGAANHHTEHAPAGLFGDKEAIKRPTTSRILCAGVPRRFQSGYVCDILTPVSFSHPQPFRRNNTTRTVSVTSSLFHARSQTLTLHISQALSLPVSLSLSLWLFR